MTTGEVLDRGSWERGTLAFGEGGTDRWGTDRCWSASLGWWWVLARWRVFGAVSTDLRLSSLALLHHTLALHPTHHPTPSPFTPYHPFTVFPYHPSHPSVPPCPSLCTYHYHPPPAHPCWQISPGQWPKYRLGSARRAAGGGGRSIGGIDGPGQTGIFALDFACEPRARTSRAADVNAVNAMHHACEFPTSSLCTVPLYHHRLIVAHRFNADPGHRAHLVHSVPITQVTDIVPSLTGIITHTHTHRERVNGLNAAGDMSDGRCCE